MTTMRHRGPAPAAAGEAEAGVVQTIHPTSNAEPARRFLPQLDGLRAFAVSAVVIHHLLSDYQLPGGLSIGLVGVQLFFVLCGFLITGLLLDGRDAIDRAGAEPGHVLRRFYARRTLRIFPLYYAVIVIGLLVGSTGVRDSWPYLATFTYNLRVAWLGYWPDNYAHFWSLCVEEQF